MHQKILKLYIYIISKLAHIYINKTKPVVIWVTGSVGKTSCRMIIYQTLKIILGNNIIYTSPKNFNGEIGTALSIFEIEKFGPNPWLFVKSLGIMIWNTLFGKPSYDVILIEYWIDHIWEMDLQLGIARPDISVWTGVDMVHSSNYPNNDPSYIATEKAKLPLNTKKTVFLNKNDKYCREYTSKILTDLFVFDTSDGSVDKSSKIQINSNMTWSHNIAYINISTIIAEILAQKFGYKDIKNSYDVNYDLQAGRYTILEAINDNIIIDSSYNGAPASMRATIKQVVDNMDKISKWAKLILVLWEMRELGSLSNKEHEDLIQYIYDLGVENLDKLVLVSGDMVIYWSEEAKKLGLDFVDYGDSLTAGKWLKDYLEQNSDNKYIILFKSSQWQIYLEEGIKYILKNKSDINKLCRQDDEWLKIKIRQNKLDK